MWKTFSFRPQLSSSLFSSAEGGSYWVAFFYVRNVYLWLWCGVIHMPFRLLRINFMVEPLISRPTWKHSQFLGSYWLFSRGLRRIRDKKWRTNFSPERLFIKFVCRFIKRRHAKPHPDNFHPYLWAWCMIAMEFLNWLSLEDGMVDLENFFDIDTSTQSVVKTGAEK